MRKIKNKIKSLPTKEIRPHAKGRFKGITEEEMKLLTPKQRKFIEAWG